MSVRVTPQLVAAGGDLTHQVRVHRRLLAHHEERGAHLVAVEQVENPRRHHRVGAVVEGQGRRARLPRQVYLARPLQAGQADLAVAQQQVGPRPGQQRVLGEDVLTRRDALVGSPRGQQSAPQQLQIRQRSRAQGQQVGQLLARQPALAPLLARQRARAVAHLHQHLRARHHPAVRGVALHPQLPQPVLDVPRVNLRPERLHVADGHEAVVQQHRDVPDGQGAVSLDRQLDRPGHRAAPGRTGDEEAAGVLQRFQERGLADGGGLAARLRIAGQGLCQPDVVGQLVVSPVLRAG